MKITKPAEFQRACHLKLRRERDSNPRRCDPQRFSRPPQSTTLPSLLEYFIQQSASRLRVQSYKLFFFYANYSEYFFLIFYADFYNSLILNPETLLLLLWQAR